MRRGSATAPHAGRHRVAAAVTPTRPCSRYSATKTSPPPSSIISSALPPPRATQVSGVLRDYHRQARLLHQQAAEVTQQRAAAGEHHAALGDVGAEVGRGLFERGMVLT